MILPSFIEVLCILMIPLVPDHVNVDNAVIALCKVEEWDVETAVWNTRQEVILMITMIWP